MNINCQITTKCATLSKIQIFSQTKQSLIQHLLHVRHNEEPRYQMSKGLDPTTGTSTSCNCKSLCKEYASNTACNAKHRVKDKFQENEKAKSMHVLRYIADMLIRSSSFFKVQNPMQVYKSLHTWPRLAKQKGKTTKLLLQPGQPRHRKNHHQEIIWLD